MSDELANLVFTPPGSMIRNWIFQLAGISWERDSVMPSRANLLFDC
jgi:hypothetical protein